MEPAKFYHIYNHANGNENLFREDDNYLFFLKKFALYINPIADTYAYCLMPNHIHFLIKIKEEEILIEYFTRDRKELKDLSDFQNLAGLVSKQFSNLFNSYAKAYNKLFARRGSLFNKPFKRKEIDNENYLTKVIHYIHANPIHHGFTKDIREWPYSSYHSHLLTKPTSLKREEVLSWFGGTTEFTTFHAQSIERKLAVEMDF
jgi:putative transposase